MARVGQIQPVPAPQVNPRHLPAGFSNPNKPYSLSLPKHQTRQDTAARVTDVDERLPTTCPLPCHWHWQVPASPTMSAQLPTPTHCHVTCSPPHHWGWRAPASPNDNNNHPVPNTHPLPPSTTTTPTHHPPIRWWNAPKMVLTGPNAHDQGEGMVRNVNSDEDRWKRAQVSTPSPLHPPSQIAEPPPACQGPPLHIRTHGSTPLSTRNPMTACPPWMRPDRHEDSEPQQQRVNDPDEEHDLCYGVKRENASRSGTSQNPQTPTPNQHQSQKHKSHILIVWGGDFWGMHRIDLTGTSNIRFVTVW